MRPAQVFFAEFLGTAFLLAVVVGSGVMGERLGGGNQALILLVNSIATGAGLVALILAFAPVSGAHFNPLVSVMFCLRGDLPWRLLPGYLLAQCVGAVTGVIATHGMFGMALFEVASKPRPGLDLMWSEFIATLGLLLVIHRVSRARPEAVAYAVGCYIAAAYWFTSSTSFANPSVTLARSLTDSFTGIAPAYVPGFIVAQVIAAGAVALYIKAIR
ncbi:MAG TPA: MIP/aquaporin family protein [Gammaproteobacteria bacterium]|jgi:glycerol uptake facilitator-like aquaporin|nr:MIP/aquaporin family protein [Gammaproteobacteria bacterium]